MSRIAIPVASFFVACTLLMVAVGIAAGILAAGIAIANGATPEQMAADPQALITPGVLGLTVTLTTVGMGGISVLLAQFLDRDEATVQQVLGLDRAGGLHWLAAGLAGGLTIGLLPGWCAARLLELYPHLGGTQALLGTALREGQPLGLSLLVFGVVVGAPIAEELGFRGFLWHHLGRGLPMWGVWIASSIAFAIYHMDPVQSVSLIPTALFLGWLRWRSGSAAPAMVGHAVNNGLAVALTLALPLSAEVPLGLALGGAVFALAACALAEAWESRWNQS